MEALFPGRESKPFSSILTQSLHVQFPVPGIGVMLSTYLRAGMPSKSLYCCNSYLDTGAIRPHIYEPIAPVLPPMLVAKRPVKIRLPFFLRKL
jgi:hypothetical protein